MRQYSRNAVTMRQYKHVKCMIRIQAIYNTNPKMIIEYMIHAYNHHIGSLCMPPFDISSSSRPSSVHIYSSLIHQEYVLERHNYGKIPIRCIDLTFEVMYVS